MAAQSGLVGTGAGTGWDQLGPAGTSWDQLGPWMVYNRIQQITDICYTYYIYDVLIILQTKGGITQTDSVEHKIAIFFGGLRILNDTCNEAEK